MKVGQVFERKGDFQYTYVGNFAIITEVTEKYLSCKSNKGINYEPISKEILPEVFVERDKIIDGADLGLLSIWISEDSRLRNNVRKSGTLSYNDLAAIRTIKAPEYRAEGDRIYRIQDSLEDIVRTCYPNDPYDTEFSRLKAVLLQDVDTYRSIRTQFNSVYQPMAIFKNSAFLFPQRYPGKILDEFSLNCQELMCGVAGMGIEKFEKYYSII